MRIEGKVAPGSAASALLQPPSLFFECPGMHSEAAASAGDEALHTHSDLPL